MTKPKTYLESFALRLSHARGVDRLIGRAENRFEGDGLNWGAADTASMMASNSSLADVVTPTHRCSGHPPVGTQRI
jgi:hypothetical protein